MSATLAAGRNPPAMVAFVATSGFLVAAAWLATGYALTVLAVCVCLVTLIPIALRRESFDVFAPWNYLFYFVLLNVLVRSMLLDLELGNDAIDFNATFYRDQPPDFLINSMALMLCGFVFLATGYLLPKSRPEVLQLRIFQSEVFHASRYRSLVVWLLLISLAAVAGFVAMTFAGVGDFTLRMLSSHRGLSSDLTEYRGYGYLRLLAGLSSLAAYLAYVQSRLNPSVRERRFYRRALYVAVLVSLMMAFYTQSRAALIFVFLNIIFIRYYLEGRRLPWKILIVVAPVIVTLFIITSGLRSGSGVNLTERIRPINVVAPIVLTNGGIDASKTGHIINYFDATQEFKLGQSLVQFVWAVVPREIWPSKPPNLDTEIGEKIYGARTYGSSAVPPGFFGEMYMNFWYAGIVMGALLLGMVIKRIDNLLRGNRHNVNFILCYVLLLQQIGLSVMGSGVSSTIIGVLSVGVPLIASLYYVTPRRQQAARS
jgi:oligosaccharide repeat unit polymerase